MSDTRSGEPGYISRQVTRARRFYFGREPAVAGGAMEVRGGGWELAAKDYTINRDTFPWLGIEFVARGRGRLRMRGATRELERGVFFAYGPGVPHRIETDSKSVLSKYYVNFSGREAADLMAAAMLEPGECRLAGDADEVEAAFETLIAEGSADRPQASAIAALQSRILLLKLADGSDAGTSEDGLSRRTLRRCLAHIEKSFLETRTAEELAAACHVSVGHMTRSFARHGYGSPYRHLTRRKMLHAAALLDSGTLLVREVADRLGLDAFQFSRVFKRVHGISPSEFARRHGAAKSGPGEAKD